MVSAAPATTSQDILLEALKAHLPAPLLDAVGNKLKQLDFAEMKIQVLEERLRKRRIEKYGSKSDKLPSAQLELLELEPGVSSAEVEAEAEREPLEQIQQQNRKKRRPHPGRQKLPADLPRVERIVACTAEQCFCQSCGKETTVIGYDESEMLDVEPAKYFVQATRREKRACKHCEAGGVAMAPVPPRIIEKSLVSDRIIIDTILDKYTAHLPLYRQSALLERDCGIDISRSTMDGWVMRVGELLMPSYSAEVISRRMKRRSLCKCTMAAATTTRRTCGSTAFPAAAWSSTFAWAAPAKVRGRFWISSTSYFRPTATRPMTAWAEGTLFMRLAGVMLEESSSTL
jgi:transposase